MDPAAVTILALAGVLTLAPALIDRWALRHGASPETLIGLAIVTLAGIAALPVAFLICVSRTADRHGATTVTSILAVSGLLLVAITAGRVLARAIVIRRHWQALASIAATLEPADQSSQVKVLPVSDLLAFASGTQAFVSQGLIDRLNPNERLAVLEHEREHARHGHGRLLAAARALTHGTFDLTPAKRASRIIDRELDVLADQAAARRLGDPRTVRNALQTIATHTSTPPSTPEQDILQRRLRNLEPDASPHSRIVDHAVRVATLTIAAGVLTAICLSIHTTTSLWPGVAACILLVASVYTFTRPVITPPPPLAMRSRGERG